MAVESRHAEKNALYLMLAVKNGVLTLEQAISQQSAIMEPEDTELVEKKLNDFIKRNENN